MFNLLKKFKKLNKRFKLGILSLVTFILCLYFLFLPQMQRNRKHQRTLPTLVKTSIKNLPRPLRQNKYLVKSENCKILEMNPWNPIVKEYMKRKKTLIELTAKKTTCPEKILTVSRGNRMFKYTEYAKNHYVAPCYYRGTQRVTQDPSNYTDKADSEIRKEDLIQIPEPHKPQIKAPHEFLEILCPVGKYDKSKFNKNYEAIVIPPAEHSNLTNAKLNFWKSIQNSNEAMILKGDPNSNKNIQHFLPPSVLIIGVDAVSRLHMIRSMPSTRKFLAQNDFVEMRGYTKIDDNTFGNVMGVLLGQDPYNYTCWTNNSQKLDDCPFIWKNFSKQNYVTALIEDMPKIGVFNYGKTGFVQQPTDYFMRPMTLDYSKYLGSEGPGNCDIDGGETQFLLNYIQEFVTEMSGKIPYFLFSWFGSTSHDRMDLLQTMDTRFLEFFSEANKTGGDNTIIIFMSDHGYRYGKFRESFLGFYEEALPSFFIRLPPTIQRSHPDWYSHLKKNQNRLTSPLDLHATLEDILSLSNYAKFPNFVKADTELKFTHYNRQPQFRKVYSFFEETPQNRSCTSSGIPQDYCRCGVHPNSAKTSQNSLTFGYLIVDKINKILKNQIELKKCDMFSLTKILYARELSVGEGESSHSLGSPSKRNYVIGLEVAPSKARFEGKVEEYESDKFRVVGVVSRISSYGEMEDCGVDPKLWMYCSCVGVRKRLEKMRFMKKTTGMRAMVGNN